MKVRFGYGMLRSWSNHLPYQQTECYVTGHLCSRQTENFSPVKMFYRETRLSFGRRIQVPHLFTLEGHISPVTEYAFSPDSKLFVSGGEDSTISLWEVQTGKRLAYLMGYTKKSIGGFAFSADGKTLASGSGNKILLWDVNTRKQLNNFDAVNDIDALAFSPNGKSIACGTEDGLIQVWRLTPNPQIQTTFSGHQGSVNVLMFSPDGKTLASGSGDGTMLLWEYATIVSKFRI